MSIKKNVIIPASVVALICAVLLLAINLLIHYDQQRYSSSLKNSNVAENDIPSSESKSSDLEDINRSTQQPINHYNVGLDYYEDGDYHLAVNSFTRAIIEDPKHSEAFRDRGAAYISLLNYERAISDFNKAIELNPKDYKAYHNRGITKSRLGDLRGSLSDFSNAIDINPLGEIYIARGEVKYNLRNREGACLDFSIAGEKGAFQAYSLIRQYCN